MSGIASSSAAGFPAVDLCCASVMPHCADAENGHFTLDKQAELCDNSVDRARRGTSGTLYPQSAIAGLNSCPRPVVVGLGDARGVEGWVRRNGSHRTPSGRERSSGKVILSCAADRPTRATCVVTTRNGPVDGRCTIASFRRPEVETGAAFSFHTPRQEISAQGHPCPQRE